MTSTLKLLREGIWIPVGKNYEYLVKDSDMREVSEESVIGYIARAREEIEELDQNFREMLRGIKSVRKIKYM